MAITNIQIMPNLAKPSSVWIIRHGVKNTPWRQKIHVKNTSWRQKYAKGTPWRQKVCRDITRVRSAKNKSRSGWSQFEYIAKIIYLAFRSPIWSLFVQIHKLTKSKSRSITSPFKHFSKSQIQEDILFWSLYYPIHIKSLHK